MQKVMRKAADGHRQSMELLFNETKNHIFYLTYSILLDEKQSENAVIFIYESLWRDGHLNKMTSKEELVAYLELKVARYCRNMILKKNKRAFHVPQQKNFHISGLLETVNKQGELTQEVMKQFPILQRFIFVLHTVGNCSDDEIAKVLNWKPQVLQLALEAEERNIEKILILQEKFGVTVQEWIQIFMNDEGEAEISEQAEQKISAGINSIATPIEKKKKHQTILACALGVLILAFVGVGSYYMTKTLKDSAKTNSEKQGGDPNGDGTGGSEETITGEFSENGFENNLSHTRGAISMARSDDYDSASSQFFIVHEESPHLDGSYAVFGYVTEGLEIVDEICESAEPTDDNGSIPSEEQPVITSITIRREEA